MTIEPDQIITLAIETSCDDTSAAVLKGRTLLSNVVASQLLDTRFGGVVPELASRQHIRQILPVIRFALEKGGVGLRDIDQIAVTCGPGLVGSLLVGLNTAQSLAYSLEIPMIPVNHIEAHLLAVYLEREHVSLPAVALIVSGGHTLLVEMTGIGQYKLIGETRDDAAGECFDKVARALGLLSSAELTMGGPVIEANASKGNPQRYEFPRPMIRSNDFGFSFSGLKTAMIQFIQTLSADEINSHMADICAGFQEAVVDVLTGKSILACLASQSKTLIVAGGVAANNRLKAKLQIAAASHDITIYSPSKIYCTDNAAMVGITGWLRAEELRTNNLSFGPKPSLRIDERV